MSEPEFWRSTPFMTRLYCKASAERDTNQLRHDVIAGFYVVKWQRMKRPSGAALQNELKVFDKEKRATRRQSPEEMLRVAEMITAAFGGKDTRNKSMDH
jgi:hypothetical protein